MQMKLRSFTLNAPMETTTMPMPALVASCDESSATPVLSREGKAYARNTRNTPRFTCYTPFQPFQAFRFTPYIPETERNDQGKADACVMMQMKLRKQNLSRTFI